MSDIDWSALTPAQQQALLDGPSLAPPNNTVSDFNNPPNGNGVSYATISICLSLATVFLFLRFYATFACLKHPYLSDYVMIVAYLFYVPFLSILLVEVDYLGYFVHMWNIRLRDLSHMLYLFTVGTNLFAVTVGFVKAAIILEWLRIFVPRGTRNAFFWISWFLLVLNILINVAGLFTINLTCIPHEKIWNRVMVPGHCIDSHAIDISSASINLGIDLLILVLPQRVIWTLKIPTSKRLGVAAVFTVGLLGCVAAIFRLVATIHYSFSPDVTYNFSAVGLWAVAEITCGILVFSVPTAPKAFAGLGKLKSLASAQSWSSRSQGDGKPFPPRSSANKRSKPRMYEELDESQLITMDTLRPGGGLTQSHVSMHEPVEEEITQASILRQTHISTESEHFDGVENAKDYLNRQHPWD
ncbi:hypothetical protein F4678DRAFT_460836 [Xylaria arbuscula]|nr:hypothetical protein F4678DRAFT_460836 [Xylaria arbuscula]